MKKLMKNLFVYLILILSGSIVHAQEIEWLSFEEAVAKSKEEPRKLLIDIYTDWCGWCKKMDRDAYANTHVAEYISKNFYAVKFNAEQTESIEFDGHTFKFIPQGKRGVHELAAALTNNKLSYPTTVFMDENLRIIQPIPGYMNAKSLDPILKYIGGDKFKNTKWEDFQKNYQSSL
ncbi:thioredoxin family protein [Marinoscillum luteum]|uniref:Thioredoxin family protein n=2 Tax=Marinoscillum TaxID=643701 RepID=A0ABW7NDM0_9BACT